MKGYKISLPFVILILSMGHNTSSAVAETKGYLDIPSEYCPSHRQLVARWTDGNIITLMNGDCKFSPVLEIEQQMLANAMNSSCYDPGWNRQQVVAYYQNLITNTQNNEADCKRNAIQRDAEKRRENAARLEAERQAALSKRQAEIESQKSSSKQKSCYPGNVNAMACLEVKQLGKPYPDLYLHAFAKNTCEYFISMLVRTCDGGVCRVDPQTVGPKQKSDDLSSEGTEPQVVGANALSRCY